MKKRGRIVLPIITAITSIFLTTLVSAQTVGEEILRNISDTVTGLMQQIGADTANLTIALLGVLLFIIIYSIVVQVFSFQGKMSKITAFGITLVVVILSFIYIPDNFLETIALQYSAMGAAILTIIPLVILLYFTVVVSKNLFMARVIWIFYAVYYFSLFIYKVAISPVEGGFWVTVFAVDNIPYLGAIIAGIIIAIYIGTIRGKIFEGELGSKAEKAMRGIKVREASREVEDEEAKSRLKA
tara:strand:+ start:1060 stop:1785 length:726 start_codon:yes stop_codon:yes gene_type:complete